MKSGDGIRLRDSEVVVLFSGLQTQSPENGNFSIVCRSRTRILVGDGSNVGLRGDLRHAKSCYPGTFRSKRMKFSENRNAWLTTQGSNFHIPNWKKTFEMSRENPLISPKWSPRDFSRSEAH